MTKNTRHFFVLYPASAMTMGLCGDKIKNLKLKKIMLRLFALVDIHRSKRWTIGWGEDLVVNVIYLSCRQYFHVVCNDDNDCKCNILN